MRHAQHQDPEKKKDAGDTAGMLALEIAGGPLGEAIHILESVEDMLSPPARQVAPPTIRPRDQMNPAKAATLRGPGVEP